MTFWSSAARVANIGVAFGLAWIVFDGVRARFALPVEVLNERRIMDRDPPIYKPGEVVVYSNRVRNKEDCLIEITRMVISLDGKVRFRAAQETRIIQGDNIVAANVNRVPLPSPLEDGYYGLHTFARYHCTALDEFFGRYTFSAALPIEIKN